MRLTLLGWLRIHEITMYDGPLIRDTTDYGLSVPDGFHCDVFVARSRYSCSSGIPEHTKPVSEILANFVTPPPLS